MEMLKHTERRGTNNGREPGRWALLKSVIGRYKGVARQTKRTRIMI